MARRKKKRTWRRLMILLLLSAVCWGGWKVYRLYRSIYRPNVVLEGDRDAWLYIRTGASFEDVLQGLLKGERIRDSASFVWVADMKKYRDRIKPGRYHLKEGMSNEALVNMLRSGEQEPLRLSFNHIHIPEELAGILGRALEADSADFLRVLNDNAGLKDQGIGWSRAFYVCLPNTYDFYWTTTPEQFIGIMTDHYRRFWTEERIAVAEGMKMSVKEVTILASIVEMEAWKQDERPVVAGVYMNRLRIGMRLQADPTLIFAAGDFSIRRVTQDHLNIESPYNTYKYAGLPPGPICLPSVSALNSVLNHSRHDYLYFCAKDDLSGYHNFAVSYAQHLENARRYRRALNIRNIR